MQKAIFGKKELLVFSGEKFEKFKNIRSVGCIIYEMFLLKSAFTNIDLLAAKIKIPDLESSFKLKSIF